MANRIQKVLEDANIKLASWRRMPWAHRADNYFDHKNAESLRRSLFRKLERLGRAVILSPVPQPA